MTLAAENVIDLSPNAEFLGAGLVRILAGNMVAGGLFLLAMSVAVHLLVTKVGWWEAEPAVSQIAGAGLFLVVGGVAIGLPAGGADLRPVWHFVRLAAYTGLAGGLLFLTVCAVVVRRARPGR